MRFLSALFVLILLQGCGYKPVSHHIHDALGDRIHIDIAINLYDPENSVVLKDAVLQAVLTRLHGKIAPTKEYANSLLHVSLNGVNVSSLAESREGFTLFYRATVSLHFLYKDQYGKQEEFSSQGKYDFSVERSSILSDSKRFEAIKNASIQAFDSFISHLMVREILHVKS